MDDRREQLSSLFQLYRAWFAFFDGLQVMEAVATARIRFLDGENRGSRERGGDDTSLSPHQKLSALCLTLLQRDWSGGDIK